MKIWERNPSSSYCQTEIRLLNMGISTELAPKRYIIKKYIMHELKEGSSSYFAT